MSPKNTAAKNLVYISDSLNDQWGDLLTSFKLDFFSSTGDVLTKRPYFIVVEKLEDIDFDISWDCKIFTTSVWGAELSEHRYFKHYAGTLSQDLSQSVWGKNFLSRSFLHPETFSLEAEGENKYYRWSVPHVLAFGTYCDQIFIELVARGYRLTQVKAYLDELFYFFNVNLQSSILKAPFEIDLIIFEDWFSLQILSHCENYWMEYCERALSAESKGDKLDGIFNRLNQQTLALEVLFLRNSKKLCLTSIHTKDSASSPIISLQNIDSFEVKQNVSWAGPAAKSKFEVSDKIKVVDAPQIEVVSGDHKLAHLKRAIRFVKKKLGDNPIEEIGAELIKGVLAEYPNARIVRGFDGEDYKFIQSCLKDSFVGDNFEKTFEEIYTQEASDDFLDDLMSNLGAMSLEEVSEVVFDGSEDYSETLTRVGGWVDRDDSNDATIVKGSAPEKEDVTVVKGEREDLAADDNHKSVIKGGNKIEGPNREVVASFSKDDFSNKASDLWEVKKLQLSEKIREEVEKIKHESPSVEVVAAKVRSIVASELKINPNDCESLVGGLIESSSDSLVGEKLGKSSDEVREELQSLKFQLEIDKKDDQLKRMKRIIDSMKEQISQKMHQERSGDDQERAENLHDSREWQSKLNELESENQELRRNMRALELEQEKSVASHPQSTPEDQHQTDQEDEAETISKSEADEMIEREQSKANREIERVGGSLEMAERRIEMMNSKLEEKHRAFQEVSSQKAAAESRSNMIAAAMSKYKARSETLERKVRQLEESLQNKEKEFEKLQQSGGEKVVDAAAKNESKEQQQEIDSLKGTLNETERNLKGALLKIKQLEQKTKFMTSKLDEAQKNSRRAVGAANGGGQSTQQLEHKIKQLEMLNKKVGGASQKLSDELSEKRKNVLDLKNENTLLQNKIKELERKNGKNAA